MMGFFVDALVCNVSNEKGSFNSHVLDATLYLLVFSDFKNSTASG